MLNYGDLFKVIGMCVGIPFGTYLLYVGLKERSRALIAHALGWLLFLMTLYPYASFSLQKILMGVSGVFMSFGVSSIIYTRDPKKLLYLGILSMMLLLNPLYGELGALFFSGTSLETFIDVIHVAQYGFLLVVLGVLVYSSSREIECRRLGLTYSLFGLTFLAYPFAKAISMEFRAFDIFVAFLLGLFLVFHVSDVMKRKIELIIPERTAFLEEMKRINVLNREEAKLILSKFKSFPVLAFVRDTDHPNSWNLYIITNAPIRKENTIFPTNLPLIIELSVCYMREAKKKGASGIVYLNCLEYLRLYNSFNSLLKFLHSLRDYALIYDATLIIEIEEEAWDRRELTLLKEIEV